MDEEKIFEALDKFPETVKKVDELAEAVTANNKTVSASVQTISKTVSGLYTRMSQMERNFSEMKKSADSANAAMRKEVTVNVPPVSVRKSDININQTPLSDAQLETMAETLAKKTDSKAKGGNFLFYAFLALMAFMAFSAILFLSGYKNDYRGWGARYVEVGKVAGDLHPGDRFVYIQEEFSKGRKAKKAAKALVEEQEEKYGDQYKRNVRIMSRDLTKALQDEAVILDYYVAEADTLGYEAFTIFRPVDSEIRIAAHMYKDGKVFLNSDADLVQSAEVAKQHPGRKTWKSVGSYK
ncbi:MAG: hypothetical protein IJQ93_10620 [Bacteroidales bacterium]|nr:hypothetical protein [Bacteroidales bacterium]